MRVLFDENVPAPLRQALAHHEVKTLQEQGWRGISNGDLVSLTEGRFEVLVLADKNLWFGAVGAVVLPGLGNEELGAAVIVFVDDLRRGFRRNAVP